MTSSAIISCQIETLESEKFEGSPNLHPIPEPMHRRTGTIIIKIGSVLECSDEDASHFRGQSRGTPRELSFSTYVFDSNITCLTMMREIQILHMRKYGESWTLQLLTPSLLPSAIKEDVWLDLSWSLCYSVVRPLL